MDQKSAAGALNPDAAYGGPRQVSAWNLPNVLTAFRVILAPVMVVLLWTDSGQGGGWRWWAFGVFVLASVTDKLDGKLARRWNIVTPFGALADPIADKLLTGSAFLALAGQGEVPWWIVVVILVREWGLTLWRLVRAPQEVVSASSWGKGKTVLQVLTLGLALLPFALHWQPLAVLVQVLFLVTMVVTVLTVFPYVYRRRS